MTESGSAVRPIIVDLGKTRKRRIRRLKAGYGRLMDEVNEVVADVKADLGDQAKGKEFVPVVIVYRRKRKRGGKSVFPIPLPFR